MATIGTFKKTGTEYTGEIFTLSLQGTSDWVDETMNAHVIEDLVDVNFGPDEPAPRIVSDRIGAALTAEALKALVDAGVITADEVKAGGPALMTWLGSTFALGGSNVAYGTVLMMVLYLGAWFWLRETAAGRHIYAVGNSPEATRLAGISTEKVLLGVYVLAGVFYGIASMLTVARTGAGDPNGDRLKTWTPSPRSCWAAPACSAVAASCSAPWLAR